MINTIILDIGQVLADFCWKEYLEECGYDKETRERISKATVLGEYWGEQDRGLLSTHELIQLCTGKDPGVKQEITKLFEDVSKLVAEYDYSEDFIKSLKANGYKVYLLSNFGTNFETLKESFRFYPYVDGGVISYEVKQIKPEPEIYQSLIKKYDIDPKEAVFLDDREDNLESAKELGFHTIKVEKFEKAVEDLRELGVKI